MKLNMTIQVEQINHQKQLNELDQWTINRTIRQNPRQIERPIPKSSLDTNYAQHLSLSLSLLQLNFSLSLDGNTTAQITKPSVSVRTKNDA